MSAPQKAVDSVGDAWADLEIMMKRFVQYSGGSQCSSMHLNVH
jgi:hypothetical protein